MSLVSAYKRDSFFLLHQLLLWTYSLEFFSISLCMICVGPMEGVVDAGVLPSQHGGVLLEIGPRRT